MQTGIGMSLPLCKLRCPHPRSDERNSNGRGNNVPYSAQELRHSGEGERMQMQRASTASEAVAVVKSRLQKGLTISSYMYVDVLKRCLKQKDVRAAKEVQKCIMESGMEQDMYVASSLLNVYVRCGRLQDARQVFDELLNNMIEGYEAYELFLRMQREGYAPDAITYMSILNVCASAGALEWVEEVHSHVQSSGLESDLRVGSVLVHMYAKSGSIDNARLVFDRMEEGDVVTWNIMIGWLADHGRGHEAFDLFLRMQRDGCVPDAITYLSILKACGSVGALERVKEVHRHVVSAGLESVLHCNCMVDLLGRGGQLEEAKRCIDNMPVETDAATWGALLGACRTYGNVELGEVAAKEVFKLEPNDAGPHVLLSNIYAAAGKWEEASLLRSMMQERGICKEPGCSWIEVDDKIHNFVVGDTSHPETEEIYAELKRLTEASRVKDTFLILGLCLQNIDEDKEVALCSHSEKLVFAFGLIRIPRGKPIRVYKNLRVCSDCHTAMKFISKVTGREIVARDVSRFHHFKDGLCSCGE